MEMEQLRSMGFPDELAAQALAATGGNSTLKATEWILSQSPSQSQPPSQSQSQSQNSSKPKMDSPFQSHHQQQQPKLNRFFQLQPKSSPNPDIDNSSSPPNPKRPKTLVLPQNPNQPLSERMRPRTVDDVVGQDHLLSNANSLIRSAVDRNRLPSLIFWGPPGTGKTSLAKAILNSSNSCSYRFATLSAVTCGVKDLRDAVDDAKKWKKTKRTVLFVDEVHRFNKSQQDSFLPVIEDGTIVFFGATTENPSFHLITPLLSRCRVLTLNPLKPDHVVTLLKRAVDDSNRGLRRSVGSRVEVNEDVIQFLSTHCDGDARVALNALEISATTAAARLPTNTKQCVDNDGDDHDIGSVVTINLDDAKEAFQCKHLAYDKAGEEHYNLISALHKSMRGSDPNAAIYWLARMLEGGEEPLYIARRLVRFASEDVGLADPCGLTQAIACYQACHFLGMPECNVNLAQCVAYLALAPKSVAVYKAMEAAQKVVRESIGQNEGVPLHLRNAPTKLMKELGYGKGYLYPPDNPLASSQSYLPPSLQGYKFLNWPTNSAGDE